MATEEVDVLVHLSGQRQFIAGTAETGTAMKSLGAETEMTGRAMQHTTQRSYLMNQALFTVRRVLYGVTLATIGAGVAAFHLGYAYNSAMQSATVALRPVFNSTQELNKELDYLFNFTKYTPFQFKDVTIAFRMMYAALHPIGISVDDINLTVKSLTDALAYAGKTSPGQLNRVAIALQHMAYQGHLTGYAVNQLARDGIPMFAILRKELGLTGEQIHNIGKLGIPTAVVLQAINRYIESTPGFANAAYNQATRTVHGLFTTFKDNVGQLFGFIENRPFAGTQNFFARFNAFLGGIANQVKHGQITSVQQLIEQIAGKGGGMLWHQIASDVRLLWAAFSGLFMSLLHSKPLWATVYTTLVLLHGILVILNPIVQHFGVLLWFLIPAFVAYKVASWAAALATWRLTQAEIINSGVVKKMTFLQFLAALMSGKFVIALRLQIAALWLSTWATRAYTFAQSLLIVSLARLRGELIGLWILMELNPVFLIVTAVVALTAGLVILYFKWKWFHDLVNSTWNFIMRNAPYVAAAITVAFGPLGAVLATMLLIVKYWDQIRGIEHHAKHQIKQTGKGGLWGIRWGTVLPRFAEGGTMPWSGPAWVGENGPELAFLPGGTRVANAQQSRNFHPPEAWNNPRHRQPIIVQLKLRERILEQVLVDLEQDRLARQ